MSNSDFLLNLQPPEPELSIDDFALDTDKPAQETVEMAQDDFLPEVGSPYEYVSQQAEIEKQQGLEDEPSEVSSILGDLVGGAQETFSGKAPARAAISVMQDVIDATSALDKMTGVGMVKSMMPEAQVREGAQVVTDNFMNSEASKAQLEKLKPEMRTVTGEVVATVFEWLAPFKAASTALSKAPKIVKGLKESPKLARFGKESVAAVGADLFAFEANEQRISDVVEKMPVPVLQDAARALASDPNDPALIGKFKQAAEGIITNSAVDAVVQGFRGIKALMKNSVLSKDLPFDVRASTQGFDEARDVHYIGSSEGRLVNQPKTSPAKDPEKFTSSLSETINFGNIKNTDDVNAILDNIQRANAKTVTKATRGKVGWEQTQAGAEAINAVEQLAKRRTGEAFNSEQLLAASQLYDAAKKKILVAAEDVARGAPDSAKAASFKALLDSYSMIEASFMGARAEAGRALQILRLQGQHPLAKAEQLKQFVENAGGAENIQQLASGILGAASKDVATFEKALQLGIRASSLKEIMTFRQAMLLTSPQTHFRNTLSNAVNLLAQPIERLTATGGEIKAKESLEFAFGAFNSTKEAWANVGRALRDEDVMLDASRKLDVFDRPDPQLVLRRPVQGDAFGNTMRAASDYLAYYMAQANKRLSNPVFKLLSAPDAFFRTLAYNGEKRALQFREMAKGRTADDVLSDVSILDEAEKFGQRAVFQGEPGTGVKALNRVINKYPALRMIAPFVTTPANIFRESMLRTPLAPIYREFREDLAAGGARERLAMAKMRNGTVLMSAVGEGVMSGRLTGSGPSDFNRREQMKRSYGWQPYSINVGSEEKPKYVSYKGIGEPFTNIIGMAADLMEVSYNYPAFDHSFEEAYGDAMAKFLISAANNALSQTYFSGVSDFINAMSSPADAQRFIERSATSFVPSLVRRTESAISPEWEYTGGVVQALKNSLPFVSDTGIDIRDTWGERRGTFQEEAGSPTERAAMFAETMLSPFYRTKGGDSAIDKELMRLGTTVDMPSWQQSFSILGEFGTAKINLRDYPDAYFEMLRQRGKVIELPQYEGMTMKSYLDDLVSGKAALSGIYDTFNDEARDEMIKGIVSDYNKAARTKVLDMFPDLQQEVLMNLRQNPLTPVR